ncbi:Oxidoreductase FAD/NAD(P)-binding domain and Flavoprotein pyridine nucleotide cytochrome reductase domain and NADH:cytochrome b5 reductase (CBR) family and Oxidoreductase, FAD-binding domain and Ferredoxin reductase-type FAD-binding domain and Riboflavin synthase-like beta-barrel domain-containing protein [Strongyloides ratti]|uniref:NADH-cytochrome b5 reductase n=1 Tax=Strongyloides ratti TaxID=34506 RepID=A0A090KUD6_STRRB|nr:Oxidoreductase FAD/NAD(P)-binding domain and Flavoprotein pyridine nucleotide cytochrome reductase domain and NADH:cytochrome b5 reductase (CBR) family and Oxidoreductase, FAD-binding domain and Ferredoxin reductase-type FAD-binding domain and Riboflavin synthase-like beta-barrel domain-containing protein [Strongyloides ratti]CEF61031.1 Oxidoreductase FAD/NAD(P)-binding domain and Flavoprotein pyridine nucleotide cytochrome reductase domain and NADH:cytochrome b5 reductase (CBR) family and Oxid
MANSEGITLFTATTVIGIVVAAIAYFFGRRSNKIKKTLVNSEEKYNLKLIKKVELSHDTRLFTFKLPSNEECLGLPHGQHVNLIAKIDGKIVVRSYTPVSSDDDIGFVNLLIKVYFKNVHPKFPEGGKMTQYLENLSIGDSIDFRGPRGLIVYNGCGNFSVSSNKNSLPVIKKFKKIGLIGGGSGITPLYQIIKSVLKNPNDMTKMYLLYANQTENDILLHDEFDKLAKDYPHKFSVWYTIDKAGDGWKYSTGFINEEMIKKYLPSPSKDNGILMCGPPPMIEFACLPNLEKVGHESENLLRF